MLISKDPHCTYCDNRGHTKFLCPERPKRSFRKAGKYHQKWVATRTEWLNTNMPDSEGFYYCYLCDKYLRRGGGRGFEPVLLDHVKSRSRHPELRYDLDNLKPVCHSCNTAKGSRSVEEYLKEIS